MVKEIFIGTSGYNYVHWKNVFYPPELPQGKWLEFYTQHFNCVELNVTFYRLPQKKVFQNWYKRSPEGFKFVIKGSRFITHIKRLQDCREALKTFFDNAKELKDKLLCVLWQLPPSLKFEDKRLKDFVTILRKEYNFCAHSFEFRNQTWFNDLTYQILKDNDLNLCIADSPQFPKCEQITNKFLYLRFHGGSLLYGSEYSVDELNSWVNKIKRWNKRIELLLAFFNNDAYGFAVKNALQLKELLNEKL